MLTKNQKIQIPVEQADLLDSYFKNTLTSQIFIDPDLKLRHSTANAMKQFGLHITDLCKPLPETKCHFQLPKRSKMRNKF